MTAPSSSDPLQKTLHWLARYAGFPNTRLEPRVELLLLMAAFSAWEEVEGPGKADLKAIRSYDRAAYKAHAMNRSHAHFKSDNSAKV